MAALFTVSFASFAGLRALPASHGDSHGASTTLSVPSSQRPGSGTCVVRADARRRLGRRAGDEDEGTGIGALVPRAAAEQAAFVRDMEAAAAAAAAQQTERQVLMDSDVAATQQSTYQRKTKIVCTIGPTSCVCFLPHGCNTFSARPFRSPPPSPNHYFPPLPPLFPPSPPFPFPAPTYPSWRRSNTREMLWKLAETGMNVVRLNMSHGDHQSHRRVVDLVREYNKGQASQGAGNVLAIMLDTKVRARSLHPPLPWNSVGRGAENPDPKRLQGQVSQGRKECAGDYTGQQVPAPSSRSPRPPPFTSRPRLPVLLPFPPPFPSSSQGPEVRSGDLPQPIELERGESFTFTIRRGVGSHRTVSVNYDGFIDDVDVDDIILVDGELAGRPADIILMDKEREL
ncbi:unnamed protein product [Closterium sp. NIES-54]